MLWHASAINVYAIEASDGDIGTVSDFLFDDKSWRIRWLVVATGTWLSGRKLLIHPSAIGQADHERQQLSVALTKAQVDASPDILQDQPVSARMEDSLYDYYGWDPGWGGGYFGTSPNMIASPFSPPPFFGGTVAHETVSFQARDGDPDLRSVVAVAGYHIQATDGEIGHIENFLIDDAGWDIRYLVVDTRNWWPGEHVLVSPYAVREISWPDRQIRLDIARDQLRASPAWTPADTIDRAYEERLHKHYGWPGYGW